MEKISIRFFDDREVRAVWDKAVKLQALTVLIGLFAKFLGYVMIKSR